MRHLALPHVTEGRQATPSQRTHGDWSDPVDAINHHWHLYNSVCQLSFFFGTDFAYIKFFLVALFSCRTIRKNEYALSFSVISSFPIFTKKT